jgi:predicted nucleotide-binding protein
VLPSGKHLLERPDLVEYHQAIVKPKVFIGSSTEASDFAEAVHSQLARAAECTVWTEGAFGLSENTLRSLVRNLRESDFGVFIFSPDDTAQRRGKLLQVPRDNVIYEAGLFSGYLGPERCLMAVPETVGIDLPTDLRGITVGNYENSRSDNNYRSAVATFCSDVKSRIKDLGFFEGLPQESLRELCATYECCDWISDKAERVTKKKEVSSKIADFCNRNQINKHRLLEKHRVGYYIALLSAVRFDPRPSDWKLVMQIKPKKVSAGFFYYKILDAVEKLKATNNMNKDQLVALRVWLEALPPSDDKSVKARVEAL